MECSGVYLSRPVPVKASVLEISHCSVCVFCFPLCSRRRQYQPLSLQRLQYLIDLGRVDPTQPIDLTQLTNARGVTVQHLKRDYGVQLVEEVGRQDRPWGFNFYVLGFQIVPPLFQKHLCFF